MRSLLIEGRRVAEVMGLEIDQVIASRLKIGQSAASRSTLRGETIARKNGYGLL
jgi:hypothetical protein